MTVDEDKAAAIFNDWLISAMTGDPQATVDNLVLVLQGGDMAVRDQDGFAVTPNGDRMNDLRSQMSGWHFSKEVLSCGERDILYVAEQILAELDRIAGGYLR